MDILKRYSKLGWHKKLQYLTLSLLFSLILMLFSCPLPTRLPTAIQFLIFLGCFLISFGVIFLIVLSVPAQNNELTLKNVSGFKILLYALPCVIVWTFYLIAFYPGIMSTDSVIQWEQIIKFQFDDWHPVFHTLLMWLITRIWFSPAALALAQILTLAFIVGYCMYTLEKTNVNRYLLYLITAFFCLNPANGIMAVTLWKDVLFGAVIFLFTVIMIILVASNGDWLSYKRNHILFLISLLCILLFRHNGKFIVIPCVLLLFLLFKRRRKAIGILGILALCLYAVITGPFYNILKVTPAFEGESYSVPINVAGAVIANGGSLSENQTQYANSLMPIDEWKNKYDPHIADPLKGRINYDILLVDKYRFFKFLGEISIQNPNQAIRGYLDLTSVVWRIPENKNGYTGLPVVGIKENDLGLSPRILNQKITNVMTRLYTISTDKKIKWLIWRPALYLFLILLFGSLCVIRFGKSAAVIPAAALFNTLTILIAIPAQDFRYLYANVLVALPIAAFSYANPNTKQKK